MAVIGKIRQRVGLLVFLIALAILSFLLMDATGSGRGAQVNTVGEVNGVELSTLEYNKRVEQSLNNLRNSGQPVSEAARINAKNSAWRNYVKDVVAQEQYNDLGIDVSNAEMDEMLFGANAHTQIKQTPIFQDETTKQFNPQKVKDYLRTIGENGNEQAAQQWVSFKDFLNKDRKNKKYSALISKAMYVPTWMAKSKNVENNVTSDIDFVKIPYTKIQDSEVSFTDADLRNYLYNNPGEFSQDAARSIKYVTFPVEASDEDIQKTKKYIDDLANEFATTTNDSLFVLRNTSDTPFTGAYQIQSDLASSTKSAEIFASEVGTIIPTFLENNSYKTIKILDKKLVPDTVECRHILKSVQQGADDTAAKKTIDSLLVAIQNGYDFESAASAFSDDSSNKNSGGDLGKVTKGRMVAPFNNAIFYQYEVGDIFAVKTQFGWHIVEITDAYSMQEGVKLATLSRKIEPSSETIRNIYRTANEFAGRNRTAGSFEKSAEEAGYNVQSAENFTFETTNIENLGANERLLNWAFTSNVGEVSEVFDMGDKYTVALLTNKKDEGMPSIESVRTELESKVKQQKKAEKIEEAIGSNSDLNAIASQYGTTVENQSGVRYSLSAIGDLGSEPKVIASAISLDENAVSKPIAGEAGVYVIKVTSKNQPTELSDWSSLQKTEQTKISNGVEYYCTEALYNSADLDDGRLSNVR